MTAVKNHISQLFTTQAYMNTEYDIHEGSVWEQRKVSDEVNIVTVVKSDT
jgi:hypothetical protein